MHTACRTPQQRAAQRIHSKPSTCARSSHRYGACQPVWPLPGHAARSDKVPVLRLLLAPRLQAAALLQPRTAPRTQQPHVRVIAATKSDPTHTVFTHIHFVQLCKMARWIRSRSITPARRDVRLSPSSTSGKQHPSVYTRDTHPRRVVRHACLCACVCLYLWRRYSCQHMPASPMFTACRSPDGTRHATAAGRTTAARCCRPPRGMWTQ